ncbi:MAG: FeoA family protein [Candidatus Omnitrophica bacterium]|nr:FeoA family protein [Candidatus Omnitrophota bacterium]
MKISLIKAKKNYKGKIAEIVASAATQNKFMSLGLYKGREITKISHFALSGPVAVKVGRSVIALGHSMAAKIILELE